MGDFTGTSGDDSWTGTDADESASGEAGNDTLDGGGGSDNLYGGDGDDILVGGDGVSDFLFGGFGNDLLDGGEGHADLAGYADVTTGGVTVDLSITGAQDTSSAGFDTLIGIESLWGTTFDDILKGDDQDNRFIGFGGADILEGRGGSDRYEIEDARTQIVERAEDDGYDDVISSVSFTLPDNIESLVLLAWEEATLVGHGNAQNNFLRAGSIYAEELNGGAGDDKLVASDANDVLSGEAGDDTIWGYGGNDLLLGGNENDTLNAGDGDDALEGGDGDDLLNGDGGNDVLTGGAGNDSLLEGWATTP